VFLKRLFFFGCIIAFLCSCQLPSGVETPTLHAPEHDALVITNHPNFDWRGLEDASYYQIQIDDASSFADPVIDVTVETSEYKPANSMDDGVYWWRVRTFLCIGGT
jgi:hypothetical protein